MSEEAKKMDVQALFEQYNTEIKQAVVLDELNMKQVQQDLPGRRHYWVTRLMFHKQAIIKLNKLRKKAKSKIVEKIKSDSPVGINHKTVMDAAEAHEILERIDDEIIDHEFLVEYLSKIESNFRNIGFDIKNLIAIITLETT